MYNSAKGVKEKFGPLVPIANPYSLKNYFLEEHKKNINVIVYYTRKFNFLCAADY